jgi:hypothetical protein
MRAFSKSAAVLACGVAATVLLGAGAASAQEDNFSGSAGVSINSHFISYGADVWGGGDDIFGDRSTTFAWADFNILLTPELNFNFGVWSDINDNAVSGLGGNIQEIDWYTGLSYNFGPASVGVTYQEWNYASDEEKVLDVALSLNDTGWIIPDFSFAPKITWHNRLRGNGSQVEGSAFVFSVAPTFPLGDSMFSLTIPAGIAFFSDGDFQNPGSTEDGGYGYSYIGGSLGVPLSFIPASYGAWSANLDLIAYFTDDTMIPGNPEDSFLTASFGVKVGF